MRTFRCKPVPGPMAEIDIHVCHDGSLEIDVGSEYGGTLSAEYALELVEAITRRLRVANTPESDEIHSGGVHPFVERLRDAKSCCCGQSVLRVEDGILGDKTSAYGRAYRRIRCQSCNRCGPWSTAPVQAWNRTA